MRVDTKDLINGRQAAALLGVSKALVNQWVTRGFLKPVPIEGAKIFLYRIQDVEKMKDRRTARGRYDPKYTDKRKKKKMEKEAKKRLRKAALLEKKLTKEENPKKMELLLTSEINRLQLEEASNKQL